MIVSLIAAVDDERGIGKAGDLPWRLREELRRFRRLTLGKTVLMGRLTWESLPKRPLSGRRNFVLSGGPPLIDAHGTFGSLDAALAAAAAQQAPEVVVIGGAGVYAAALERADRLWLTRVPGAFGCDVFFPAGIEAGFVCADEETFDDGGLSLRLQAWRRR